MMILPMQYDRHSGPDAVGSHKLTFSIDESVGLDGFNPMEIKKGTQFIVTLIEADSKEAEEFRSETPEESKERFRRRMNSLINKYADLGVSREEFKEVLKEKGLIVESTKELDLAGYARVIALLNEKIYEREKDTGSR